eukprot:1314847-Alexandrium_andersonii.AAC.1
MLERAPEAKTRKLRNPSPEVQNPGRAFALKTQGPSMTETQELRAPPWGSKLRLGILQSTLRGSALQRSGASE